MILQFFSLYSISGFNLLKIYWQFLCSTLCLKIQCANIEKSIVYLFWSGKLKLLSLINKSVEWVFLTRILYL